MGPWSSVIFCLLANTLDVVWSHGRLIEPPSRATMWRYGFKTPPNYNDHELYCGGFSRQWQKNGGKCGVCGDPYDMTKPRPHEAGGKYGNGVIVRKYRTNSIMNIRIELTANHKGYFEFRLCPNNAPHRVVTQDCLDLYLLQLVHRGSNEDSAIADEHKYYPGVGSKIFEMKYRLPRNLTCSQCVLQWKYIAGNNWGMCPNGTGQVGCGPQEEFRACSDIAVVDSDGVADETPFDNNEIPLDEDISDLDHHDLNVLSTSGELWIMPVLVALSTLLLVLISIMLIYLYYYKRTVVKEWWVETRLPHSTNMHQDKRFSLWSFDTNHQSRFKFWRPYTVKPAEKQKNYSIPQPIPPPRTKRIMSGERHDVSVIPQF